MARKSALKSIRVQCYFGVRRTIKSQAWYRTHARKILKEIDAWGLLPSYLERSVCLEIGLLGPQRMKKINQQFRGKNLPTDVLSFEGDRIHDRSILGEILLCPVVLVAQAKRLGVPLDEEILRMMIHGTLHLCGFDHQTKGEAKRMFHVQESVLGTLVRPLPRSLKGGKTRSSKRRI